MGSCLTKSGVFINPTVEVKDIQSCGMSMKGMTINTTFKISNHNVGKLDAIEVKLKVSKQSDGTILIDGNKREPFQIPAMDSIETTVPMVVHLRGLGAASMSIVRRGKTTVVAQGSITFDAPLSPMKEVTINFEGKGTIDMTNVISSE